MMMRINLSGMRRLVMRRAKLALAARPTLRARGMTRGAACLFLAGAIAHGLIIGGHLDYTGSPWAKLPGKMASLLGFAADDIRVTGLVHQDPEMVLAAIGVQPGSSLIGFDANRARKLLENMDWVASAEVVRQFPNQLDIIVNEREPFAIWQRGGMHYVIDKSGTAVSAIDPARVSVLPLVTGEGAHMAAGDLINQLEAAPAIRSHLLAAARVGERRWTLYLDNGVKLALPEQGIEDALARVSRLDSEQGLLSKGIQGVDLRIKGRVIIEVATVKAEPEKKKKPVRLSESR
jgi:cell division protein FtsQ